MKRLLLLTCLAALSFGITPPLYAGGGPGQHSFERAYRIEKKDPETAIYYYRLAISQGLNRELRKAARWRLFYLYKDLGKYDEAMRLAKALGATKKARNMERDLVQEVASKLKVDKKTAAFYIDAVQLVAAGTPDSRPLSTERLRLAVKTYPKHDRLIRTLAKASARASNRGDLQEVFSEYPSLPCRLASIRLLIEEGEYDEARTLLYALAQEPALEPRYRPRVLYLLARSFREEDKPVAAIDYYRLAATYASSKKALYYRALAAFALYDLGYAQQARALFGRDPDPDSFHLHLLDLILRIDLDQDRSAYEELKEMQERIAKKYKRGNSPRLMKAALRILRRGPPG